jgi:hypothetical protein
MPIEDIEFYDERRDLSLDVLSPSLIHQLSRLVRRVLQADGRESSYVDESDRFLMARIARLENVAIAETDRRIACYLIELHDSAALGLKARRRLFSFEAGDSMTPGDW